MQFWVCHQEAIAIHNGGGNNLQVKLWLCPQAKYTVAWLGFSCFPCVITVWLVSAVFLVLWHSDCFKYFFCLCYDSLTGFNCFPCVMTVWLVSAVFLVLWQSDWFSCFPCVMPVWLVSAAFLVLWQSDWFSCFPCKLCDDSLIGFVRYSMLVG